MFSNKPRWTQFVLSNDPRSQYKGALRNIMMNSMAKAMGYKLNQNDGIMDRASNKLITDDPAMVAQMLLSPNATVADLYSVEAILKALEADPKRAAKIADFKAKAAYATKINDAHNGCLSTHDKTGQMYLSFKEQSVNKNPIYKINNKVVGTDTAAYLSQFRINRLRKRLNPKG
jgi:hypothetical protein